MGSWLRSTSAPCFAWYWQGGIAHYLRRHVQHLFQQGCLVPDVAHALGCIRLAQVGEYFADLAQGREVACAHAQGDALLRAKQVGEHRRVVTFRIFEQQGRAAGAQRAVGDFGHFEFGIDLGLDAHQLAALFQCGDKIPEVGVFHNAVNPSAYNEGQYTL